MEFPSFGNFLCKYPDEVGQDGCYNYDYYGFEIESTPKEWTRLIVYFSDVEGDESVEFDQSWIHAIRLKASSVIAGEEGWFEIDDVKVVENILMKK